jgi:hypothetical protein
MKKSFIHLFLLIGFALAACGAAAPRPSDSSGVTAPSVEMPVQDYAPSAPNAGEAAQPGGGGNAGNAATTTERLVIKNASLSIVVDNPDETIATITQMTNGMGGFVVTLNTYQASFGSQGQIAEQANMTIRVPSEKLDDALTQIKALAVEVRSENISGQDVTGEYTDLKSRLTNLEAAERQLQSIMEEATKTEDVLAVYNQLVYTREQIEVIKGQMKYYEESAALSAITLDIAPNIATQPIEIGGWHPEGVAKESIETLIRLVQGLVDFVIRFGIVCGPFLIVIGLPIFFIGRYLLRRMRANVAKVEAEEKAGK